MLSNHTFESIELSEHSFERRELSFAQVEGAEPLPQQMALKTVSNVLAARLFEVFHTVLVRSEESRSYNIQGPWSAVFRRHHIEVLGGFSDEFSYDSRKLTSIYKAIFISKQYLKIFGTVEWFVRNSPYANFVTAVENILSEERSAYRIVDKRDIVPLVSEHEAKALMGALAALDNHGIQGRVHT